MFRSSAALAVLAILLTSCSNDARSKEKVQEAIINRLQTKSGLDLKALDVTTTSVSFKKNMAFATVAFHPKGDTSVTGGMVMKYTLENRDGKWIVVNVGDSQGRGMPGHPSTDGRQLPPGHPAIGAGQPLDQPNGESVGQPGADGRTR